jgi:methylmalonyl-CoA carboxyltransferase large subunit
MTTQGSAPDPSVAELLEVVRRLSERIGRLEEAVARLDPLAEPPEDVVIAISAAVAAFLGNRAKVKQVHYRTGAAYAQLGRAVVQGKHDVHGSR